MPCLLTEFHSVLVEGERVAEDAGFPVVGGEGESTREDGADGGYGVEYTDEVDIAVSGHCLFVVGAIEDVVVSM